MGESDIGREGSVSTEAEDKRLCDVGSRAKEPRWLEKSRKHSFVESPKESSHVNTLTLAQWNSFQTSELYNYMIINLCCLKPLSVWWYVIATMRSNLGVMESLEGFKQRDNVTGMEISPLQWKNRLWLLLRTSRGGVTVDMDVEAKVVISGVANHFHLLRIEGVPKIQGFLFKMEPVLPNHTSLGLQECLGCGIFVEELGKVPDNPGWIGHPGEKWRDWSYRQETESPELASLFRVRGGGSRWSLDSGRKLDGWCLYLRNWRRWWEHFGGCQAIWAPALGVGLPIGGKNANNNSKNHRFVLHHFANHQPRSYSI